MVLITCQDCGHSMSDRATVCVQCGRPVEAEPSSPLLRSQAPSGPVVGPPAPQQPELHAAPAVPPLSLFPVATHKFIVLSICTFGLYELYWCYQNWKRL